MTEEKSLRGPISVHVAPPGSHGLLALFFLGGLGLIALAVWLLEKNKVLSACLIALGVPLLVYSCVGWWCTRKDVDAKKRAPSEPSTARSELILTDDVTGHQLTLKGDGEFFKRPEIRRFASAYLSRLASQEPLPPPRGRVNGDASAGQAMSPFTEQQAAIDQKELNSKVSENEQLLRREVNKLLGGGSTLGLAEEPLPVGLPPPAAAPAAGDQDSAADEDF